MDENHLIITAGKAQKAPMNPITHYYEIINACNAPTKGLTRAEAEIDLNYAINNINAMIQKDQRFLLSPNPFFF